MGGISLNFSRRSFVKSPNFGGLAGFWRLLASRRSLEVKSGGQFSQLFPEEFNFWPKNSLFWSKSVNFDHFWSKLIDFRSSEKPKIPTN